MHDAPLSAMQWWERRRLRFNLYSIIALVAGAFSTMLVMNHFEDRIFAPIVDQNGKFITYDNDIGGIAVVGPCCASIVGMLMANVCFFLGAWSETFLRADRVFLYRTWAWRAGVLFSCLLPFSVAILHLITCLFFSQVYDRTPIVIPSS